MQGRWESGLRRDGDGAAGAALRRREPDAFALGGLEIRHGSREAAALIDRLLHHCHIVNTRGNSYRMREHRDLLRSGRPEEPAGRRRAK